MIVYPKPDPAAGPPPADAGADSGEGVPIPGDDDFHHLRAYRPGDPPRQIAWKALAREGDLLTKDFQATASGELWLDWLAARCAGENVILAGDLNSTLDHYTGLDAAPFYGVLGPAGMDPAVVQKLSSTLQQALATPALREKLQEQGFDVVASSPEAYAKLIRDEIERWSKVVREGGIRVD